MWQQLAQAKHTQQLRLFETTCWTFFYTLHATVLVEPHCNNCVNTPCLLTPPPRWRIYLTPGVKRPTQEPFNEYEVAVIYLGQQVHGNQWSSLAKLLPGRTNTAIKNLWKTALQTADAKKVQSNQ
jgi:hypothetical protein